MPEDKESALVTTQRAHDSSQNLTKTPDGEQLQFLTFILAEETYGVDILKVQEIRGWQDVTTIPNAPKHIRGVMNLRGAIVPILDLRRRFDMPEVDLTDNTVVVVVNVMERTIGMVVDAVSDVVDMPTEELRAAPDFGSNIDANFVQGLAPVEDNMVIILNVDDILKSSDLVSLDKLTDMEVEAEAEAGA